jgi:Asp-tRNA(Asn)/Glu-tRNA(Gln) amidotransferase A subunit family amidase
MTGRVMLAAKGELSGAEAVAAATMGARSVSDLVAAALDRVQECDGEIGAFRSVDGQAAMRRAKELDGHPAGPLYGLVTGVKDVIDTADFPTGYGSPLFARHQPAADADVAAALRRAGAIVLGKTESTEFAMYQPTRTRNPADLDRTPGGSSSGSAAAVAAGMVPVALGTQTAGSVIRPAAYCGVYGFKPTRDWTSTRGIWQLARHLDTVGIFARSAADLRLAYAALSTPGRRGAPDRARPARRTVAVLPGLEWGPADADVAEALGGVADRLAGAGWDVREMAMPASWAGLPGQHDTVMAVEVARSLRRALGPRVSQISDSAQAMVERGDRCTARDYLEARAAADAALAVTGPLAGTADLLLAPSALGVAPEGLDYTGDPVMCRPWTLLGLPAANIPAARRADGLPVGVQAVAPGFDDIGFLRDLVSIEAAIFGKEVT